MRALQGKVYVGEEAEALEVADNWKNREHTVWTDGPRTEGGGVGAAVV